MSGSRTAALAALVDPLLDRPAVVLGGLPGRGRDLDLLVDDPAQLACALSPLGFTPGPEGLRRLVEVDAGVRADVVEPLAPADLGLPPAAAAAVRAGALALPPHTRLRRPDPSHVLLLLAARGVGDRPLSDAHAERVDEALAERPDALARAREQARAWGVEADLAVLVRRASGRAPGPLLRVRRGAAGARRAGSGPVRAAVSGLGQVALRPVLAAVARRPAPAPLEVPPAALDWLPLLLTDLGRPGTPVRAGGPDAPPLEVAARVCAALGV